MMAELSATQSVVKVLGIHHLSIPCNDLERAVRFYTEVLGMQLVRVIESDGAPHFLGTNLPAGLQWDDSAARRDYEEYIATYQHSESWRTRRTRLAQLRAGRDEVVLFQRMEPAEHDTLRDNGIYHQSFRISAEDMARLAELKRSGTSMIRFHTGPTLRWPHGKALYLWDSEGNYIELESNEDLSSQFGLPDTHSHAVGPK